jgi:hypothetical protein
MALPPRAARVRTVVALALLAGMAAYVIPTARALTAPNHYGPLSNPIDFTAFYCGGRVLARGEDPYRSEPLRGCEDSAYASSHVQMMPQLVVPAPLPPYALAVLRPLTILPFRSAALCFFFVSVLALGCCIAASVRLSRLKPAFVVVAVSVALVVGSFFFGQVVPLALAGLGASALALQAGRVRTAAACALVTLLEPHIGLAAVLGLFVLEPRARIPLTLGLGALAGLSLAAGGFALNLEYLTQVLPAHARSEIDYFGGQYSLSALLRAAGMRGEAALRWGEASYVAMLALGLWLAGRLRRSFGDRAFAVVTPPACALVGGAFVHDCQMALALPFAFLLARYVRPRAAVLAATLVLAVPWQSLFNIAFIGHFPAPGPIDVAPLLARVAAPSLLAEAVWRVWIGVVDAREGRTPLEVLLFKLPTWCALAALGLAAVRATGGLAAARHRPGAKSAEMLATATEVPITQP